MSNFTIGVDFGTLSARAVVVDVATGRVIGSRASEYAHGVVDDTLPTTGERLPPDWALQVPQADAADAEGVEPHDVIGVGTDFTSCTVLPTTADGTPLCELPEFADRPHAYVKLWNHHAAQSHADRLNAVARERGEPWIGRYGGLVSSEWELAKALQPDPGRADAYDRLFAIPRTLHDRFGAEPALMHDLRAIRNEALTP